MDSCSELGGHRKHFCLDRLGEAEPPALATQPQAERGSDAGTSSSHLSWQSAP